MQTFDVNGKTVLGEPELYRQMLRDFLDIPLLQEIELSDIEDVTERYHLFDGVSAEADSVKRIRFRRKDHNGRTVEYDERIPIYVVTLFEHKSWVDYDVAFQILKYMVGIWQNWKAEMERQYPGCSRNKSFRYPPVLPVIYYEGAAHWTADMSLRNRVQDTGLPEEYIPDFRYKVISAHEYSTEQLLANADEISLIMMVNKIQTGSDFETLRNVPSERVDTILEDTPEHLLDILAALVQSMCRRTGVTEEETEEYVSKVRERKMGYFFENMEKMDIQAERANTQRERENAQRERERADAAETRADKAEMRADKAETHAKEEKNRADRAERQLFQSLVSRIMQIQKKYRKGKSLEQTADELEEEPDAIRQIYEAVSGNPEKSAEAIRNLICR